MTRTSAPRKRRSAGTLSATLTPRQVQILQLVRDFRSNNGCSPTMQEMAQELQISKVTVFEHVEVLVRKGLLHREPNRARSLTLDPRVARQLPAGMTAESNTRPAGQGKGVYPLSGQVSAGTPLEAIEDTDCLELTTLFETPDGTFALRVAGDSMVDEHICDGDYVLVRPCRQARDGDIVVAVLDSGEATLKRLYRRGRGFVLEGANPSFAPLHVDQVDVRGVVIGIVRRY